MSYNHTPVFKLLEEVAELRGKPKTTYKQLNPLLHKLELALKRLRYQNESFEQEISQLNALLNDDDYYNYDDDNMSWLEQEHMESDSSLQEEYDARCDNNARLDELRRIQDDKFIQDNSSIK